MLAFLGGVGGALVAIGSGIYGNLFDGELFDRQFVGGITVAGVNLIVIGAATVGVVRWHIDRRKARRGLVIPRSSAASAWLTDAGESPRPTFRCRL